MSAMLKADRTLGLVLRGYDIVPNPMLATKIGVYTPDVVETMLTSNPEIIDIWLAKLHDEYINNKKSCTFDNDPSACFNLGIYEEFEKHLASWHEGGLIKITLPNNKAIRISKKPIFSVIKN